MLAQADADVREAAVESVTDVLILAAQVTGGTLDERTMPALRNLARMTVDDLLRR